MNPKYPIYIISKGRADTRLTSKALERLGVPYTIVVEPQEFDEYAAVIDEAKILVTPFSNLGQGSIPVRNFVWEHATELGAERHWIMDDNLRGFFRFNRNRLTPVTDGTIIRCCEDFTDRFENVPMSGMNYFMFVPRKEPNIPPYYLNTRVYSCILLSNSEDFQPLEGRRWRGRYNEDTDLSLRVLKAGYCTLLFNAFICDKMTTMTMTGGNTEDLYLDPDDGRLDMARSLAEQHPDVAWVTEKWGRYQHHVDYRRFKRNNSLKLRDDFESPSEIVDNYGMRFQREVKEGVWQDENPAA